MIKIKSTHNDIQLSFDKGAKTIQWEMRVVFFKNGARGRLRVRWKR